MPWDLLRPKSFLQAPSFLLGAESCFVFSSGVSFSLLPSEVAVGWARMACTLHDFHTFRPKVEAIVFISLLLSINYSQLNGQIYYN